MTKYIDFPLGQNDVVRVEVTGDDGQRGSSQVMRGGSQVVVEKASLAFEQALSKLRPICASILAQLRDPIDQPDEIAVEIGVKLSAEAGVVLTSVATEANLKINIKWKART